MAHPTVTEQHIIDILEPVYGPYGFAQTALPARFAALLNDPAKSVVEDEGDASESASEIRKTLWSYFTGGGASASSTCQLFYKLGRQAELGWVEGEARGFTYVP